MKLGIAAYVPPPHFGHGQVFLENLRKFKTSTDLMLFSDYAPYGLLNFPDPEIARTAYHNSNKLSVNNFIFLVCVNYLRTHGYSHILYVESDSRVGADNWDGQLFEEMFANPGPIMAAGSLVCYSPCAGGAEGLERFSELIARHNIRPNYPIPRYQPKPPQFPMVKMYGGGKGANNSSGSALFPNGSLSIYNLEWLVNLLPRGDILKSATEMTAWDMEIGNRAWDIYGPDCYRIMAHLTACYSSFGDAITTESERLEMLRSGIVSSIHQVKSGATI